MTRDELLAEVSTDVKWLKTSSESNAISNNADHKQIIEHLARLNGQVARNKTHIGIQWWIITMLIIALTARIMGIY